MILYPTLADKNCANPCSLILSGVLMLRYIGWGKAASLLEYALEATIQAGNVTQDFARAMPGTIPHSTSDFADLLIKNFG
jgi:isocitrate dehydrogenase